MTKLLTFFALMMTAIAQAEENEKNPRQDKQGRVIEATDWPGNFAKVVAVAYDFTQEESKGVVVDRRLHKGVWAVSQPLTEKQVETLFSAITGTHPPLDRMMCYSPHHGYIFYDKDEAIIGSLEICFGCNRYHASRSPEGEVSRNWDLKAIEKQLKELEVPVSDDYVELFEEYKKANKAEMATPRNPSE